MLRSYKNKNIGKFISLPANKLENSTFLETLHFATYINKLKSKNNLSDIKNTPPFKYFKSNDFSPHFLKYVTNIHSIKSI